MKYVSVVLLAFIVQVGLAQGESNLKGPAAKNYKVWKDSSLKGTQVNLASASDKYEEGANAKNSHVFYENTEMTAVPNTNLKRGKGANAKNRKAYKSSSSKAVFIQSPVKETEEKSTEPIIQRR